jgi:hypothetical protein
VNSAGMRRCSHCFQRSVDERQDSTSNRITRINLHASDVNTNTPRQHYTPPAPRAVYPSATAANPHGAHSSLSRNPCAATLAFTLAHDGVDPARALSSATPTRAPSPQHSTPLIATSQVETSLDSSYRTTPSRKPTPASIARRRPEAVLVRAAQPPDRDAQDPRYRRRIHPRERKTRRARLRRAGVVVCAPTGCRARARVCQAF